MHKHSTTWVPHVLLTPLFLFPSRGLIPSKKYFWLSDEPLEHAQLSGYLASEKLKDIAHPNAAHATQTGKGLMFGAKRAEDKHHPQSIFNLVCATGRYRSSIRADVRFPILGRCDRRSEG